MSADQPATPREKSDVQKDQSEAPAPPTDEQQAPEVPEENKAEETAPTADETATAAAAAAPAVPTDELPPPGHTAPHPLQTAATSADLYTSAVPGVPGTYGIGQRSQTELSVPQTPLTINQLAIVASAQNKLPVNKCKGIVLRVGRHTESSLHKSGRWYKNHNYVDKDTYTWKNMPLFEDYQRHLWTTEGCVRSSCKK